MVSQCRLYIKSLLKEIKRLKKTAKMYKDLYHGTIPDDYIHVKREDWLKIVKKARFFDDKNETV